MLITVVTLQLFILLVSQIVGQFKYLGDTLKSEIDSFANEEISRETLKDIVRKIVEKHCDLIDYSYQLENIFSLVCFSIVSFGCITICFTGFAVAVSR